MIAKALKLNRNFIPILLLTIWVVLNYFINLNNFSKETLILQGVSMFFVVAAGIWLGKILSFDRETYFFEFFLLIFLLFLEEPQANISFYAGFLFLYITLYQSLLLLTEHNSWLNPFDLGFFMLIAIVLYPPFWIFGFYLIISFVIQGSTEFRKTLLSIFGMITALILIVEVVAIFDFWDAIKNHKKLLSLNLIEWKESYIYLFILLGILILGFIDYYSNINKQLAHKKIYVFNNIIFLLFCFVYIVLYAGDNSYPLLILSLPFATIISNYVLHKKNIIIKELIIWVVLLVLVLYRFAYNLEIPVLFDRITF